MTERLFLAGHNGMVGKAIYESLSSDYKIITAERNDLDLTNQQQVGNFFKKNKFNNVIIAAAKVGGINANRNQPTEFLHENLMIQSNLFNCSLNHNINKLLFLGSSCIYPKKNEIPIKENSLLTGTLEETNKSYAIAKIAGIHYCNSISQQYGKDFRSLMPTNLYGPNDNFNLEKSHVIPALIRKFVEAKENGLNKVSVWGSGNPKRDFLHVADLGSAVKHFMLLSKDKFSETMQSQTHINIGSGNEISIRDLASMIAKIVDFRGTIEFDASMPDGTLRKLLSIDLAKKCGWTPKINLEEGLVQTISWFNLNRTGLRS